MAAVPDPGPDDHLRLSSREKKILAGIENDLDADEPALALRMSWGIEPRKPRRRALAVLKFAGLLTAALLTIVTSLLLIPASGWASLSVLTILLVVPLLLLRVLERHDYE